MAFFTTHYKLSMKNIHYNLLYPEWLICDYLYSQSQNFFLHTIICYLKQTWLKEHRSTMRSSRVSETSTQSLCKLIWNETERFSKWKEIRGVKFHAPFSRWFRDELICCFRRNFFSIFFFKNGVRVLLYNLRTKYFDFFLLLYIFFFSRGEINAMAECFVSLYSETTSLYWSSFSPFDK